MPEEVIEEIRPDFGREHQRVNPAIDVMNGTAVVGVWLPSTVRVSRGRKKFLEARSVPFLVTEKRTLIPLVGQVPFTLASEPVEMEQRWKPEHINDFIATGKIPSPTEVFTLTLTEWKRYFVFVDPREYLFKTLWTIGTYFTHLFNTTIYDYIGGVRRTGKTKVLTMYRVLCFNAVLSGNMSSASIFRLVQNARATLLLDETEYLHDKERAMDFRNLLLSGYKKGSHVYRVEKTGRDRLVVRQFETFGSKAIANIRGLEDVLEDRVKFSVMQRADSVEAKREIDVNDSRWAEIRDKYYRLYMGYWRKVKEAYDVIGRLIAGIGAEEPETSVPPELLDAREIIKDMNPRELEIWHPMLAMALFFDREMMGDSGVFKDGKYDFADLGLVYDTSFVVTIAHLARENEGIKSVEDITETGEYILLKALMDRVAAAGYYRVRDIKNWMSAYFDEPQPWLTTKWIGNALRRLGFFDKRRLGTGYDYYISPEAVADRARRLRVFGAEERKEELQQKLIDVVAKEHAHPPEEWITCEFLTETSQFEEAGTRFGPFARGHVASLPPSAVVRLAKIRAIRPVNIDQATKMRLIDMIMLDLEREHGGLAPKDEAISAISAVCGEDYARSYVEKALRHGAMFEPKPGYIARVRGL